MVTDKDVSKLKQTFATKAEMKTMFEQFSERIVKDIGDMLQTSIINILSKHERRLDRLEKSVGGFPPIGD